MNKKGLKINENSQNKKSTKACSNLISNLQSPNSNFSTLTSHLSSLTSNSRGITLIALVITIIVMLILVGVTVTVAINGGLFNTAKDATRKTQFEADRESLLSAVIGAINDNAEVNFDKLGKSLPEGFTKTEDGYTSKSGNTFFVDRDGNIDTVTIVEKEETTTDDYGKYVKYGVDLNGDGILTNDWKVFYKDESGHTFIIAADYVTGSEISEDRTQCTEVKTAIENSHMTQIDSDSKKYCFCWNQTDVTGADPKVTYHCNDGHSELNSEKNQCSFPDIFMGTKYLCSSHVGDGTGGNINSRCASTLLCSDNWKPLVKEDEGALYAIGGPTIEMWVASWNEKHGDTVDSSSGITLYANGNDNSIEKYGYNVGISATTSDNSYSITDCSTGYDDELYFPHQIGSNLALDDDGAPNDKCNSYWLTSPSANWSSNVMVVRYNSYIGSSAYNRDDNGLRPVICLESGVKLATNGKN